MINGKEFWKLVFSINDSHGVEKTFADHCGAEDVSATFLQTNIRTSVSYAW